MILPYLILSHLLGDFLLQPTKLVLWKMKSIKGLFTHASIHFLIGILILLPFIINGHFWLIGVIFLISFVHFWIDLSKINYDLKHDKKVAPFLIDQLLHFLTILVVYFFIKDFKLVLPNTKFHQIYTDINIIIFFAFLILISVFIEILYFQKTREYSKNAKLKMYSRKMMTRVIIFTIIYIAFILIGFYVQGGQGI